MIDTHIHIERGSYSIDWVNKFVKTALERGMDEIYLLEHSHRFIEFREVYESIAQYNEFQKSWLNRKMGLSLVDYKNFISEIISVEFPIKIKFGLEVCYIEGTENLARNILHDFHWDFIIGSVHWIDGFGFDHKREFWEGKDVDDLYRRYYQIMKKLIKSNLFNTVAHPDAIKCFGNHPSFDLKETYMEIANLLNEYNMYAEQSAGLHLNYGCKELGMNKEMYDIFKSKNVKIHTASDAHKPEDVGKYIKELNDICD